MSYPAWQPIETAPKDGTEVLVIDEFGKRTTARWEWYEDYPGSWQLLVSGEWAASGTIYPTHWAPLQPPPEAA